MSVSPDTQAILLLTAPLIAGPVDSSFDLLTAGEYKRLIRFLRERQARPADLLSEEKEELLEECRQLIGGNRLETLLSRGFLLSQAIEKWQARAIWVLSGTAPGYPRRFQTRLQDDAPPVLYGCGEVETLDTGGLAVVGSRDADEVLLEYSESIGRLAAQAKRTVVSGGARGVDRAAMRGALEEGGKVVGVLSDSLERAALHRDNRQYLMDGQLTLVSPYDPMAPFHIGHAMQRNKLIYGLGQAALIVRSDREKGGTWAGAVEQLDKLKFVPVFVRECKEAGSGLEGLRRKGALPWPNPETPEALAELLSVGDGEKKEIPSSQLSLF